MKKHIFSVGLIISSFCAFAQNKEVMIGTNQQYHENDTTRTFAIFNENADDCRYKLLQHLGTPKEQSAGEIVWESRAIDGIGNNLTITFKDGILTQNLKDHSACWRPFVDEDDKKKKMNTLTNVQNRTTEIIVSDKDGNNPINNDEKEKAVKQYLLDEIKG